jgi:hypothetical protein
MLPAQSLVAPLWISITSPCCGRYDPLVDTTLHPTVARLFRVAFSESVYGTISRMVPPM